MLEENPEDEYIRRSVIEVHKKLGGDAMGSTAGAGGGTEETAASGSSQRAADQYREILKLNPDDFDAQYQIAQAFMNEKRFDEAIAELGKLHDKHPKNVEVLNLLGWACLNSGQHDRAFKTWQKSLQIDNKNTATRDNIIRARLEVGKRLREQNIHMKAIVHFKELLKFLPKSPEVHYEIGMTYLSKGDKRSALNAFNKVLQLDSKNKNARKAISELRLRD
jgi:protein O-GlcNAc transferase